MRACALLFIAVASVTHVGCGATRDDVPGEASVDASASDAFDEAIADARATEAGLNSSTDDSSPDPTIATDGSVCGSDDPCPEGGVCVVQSEDFTTQSGFCCGQTSSKCLRPTECCSGLCANGACEHALGQYCGGDADCTAPGEICTSEVRHGLASYCCKQTAAACKHRSECCSGTCSAGSCQCEAATDPAPGSCRRDADCCSGHCRPAGTCRRAVLGEPCAEDRNCNTNVCRQGSCACLPNDAPATGDQTCCSGYFYMGFCRCGSRHASCATGTYCCSGGCSSSLCD